MRTRISACVALVAAAFSPVGIAADTDAESFAPTLPGVQRFAAIWERSPFIKETVAAQTVEGLATKYAITGIVSIGEKPMVFLVDKANSGDPKGRFMVSKGNPVNGIELVSVSLKPLARDSSVVLKQGSQQAVLSYDPSQLSQMGGGGVVPNPGVVPPAPTGIPAGLIPRPAGAVNPSEEQNSAAPPMRVPPPNAPRRIIRPAINVE